MNRKLSKRIPWLAKEFPDLTRYRHTESSERTMRMLLASQCDTAASMQGTPRANRRANTVYRHLIILRASQERT